jgi:hydrogenase maturation protease
VTPRILVACVGNIFLGDDAFGVEVAQRLARRTLPDAVRVVDFGIRGFDLAYALMDDYEAVILVDAVPRGDAPGTLYTIEPDLDSIDRAAAGDAMVETHGMNPMKVLAMVKAMGGERKRVLVVGCEPTAADADEDEQRMGLSEPVAAAIDEAVRMIESLIDKLLAGARMASAP